MHKFREQSLNRQNKNQQKRFHDKWQSWCKDRANKLHFERSRGQSQWVDDEVLVRAYGTLFFSIECQCFVFHEMENAGKNIVVCQICCLINLTHTKDVQPVFNQLRTELSNKLALIEQCIAWTKCCSSGISLLLLCPFDCLEFWLKTKEEHYPEKKLNLFVFIKLYSVLCNCELLSSVWAVAQLLVYLYVVSPLTTCCFVKYILISFRFDFSGRMVSQFSSKHQKNQNLFIFLPTYCLNCVCSIFFHVFFLITLTLFPFV